MLNKQIILLQKEINENKKMTKARVLELIEITRDIAKKLDVGGCLGNILASRVEDIYTSDTKYPKKRLIKVIKLLGDTADTIGK